MTCPCGQPACPGCYVVTSVEEENYGPIFVTAGVHRGRYGYYEDDRDNWHAIVLLEGFGYTTVRRSSLARPNPNIEGWIR